MVEEFVVGTLGSSNCRSSIKTKSGQNWHYRDKGDPNPYEQEHEDLIASIAAGKPINEAQQVAESTMTGILGREAAYSGHAIMWEDAMKSTSRMGPEKYDVGAYPVPPVPMPGKYKFL
jgi:hypothetical protein